MLLLFAYDIISEESLCIANSKIVQFIIAILLYQLEPSDKINRLKIVYLYNNLFHPTKSIVDEYLSKKDIENSSVYDIFSDDEKTSIISSIHLPLYLS